jgi:hypothetical protein
MLIFEYKVDGFLDTLSVPACFLQSQQCGILEIVEKMFECSLEVL